MHIGMDDTDSTKGGCTTYLAALLIDRLSEFRVSFPDYPGLIRLNPNVPWKTSGNGALCLRFIYDSDFEEQIKDSAITLWEEQSAINEKGTDPGIVFLQTQSIPEELVLFAKKAETQIVRLEDAFTLNQEV